MFQGFCELMTRLVQAAARAKRKKGAEPRRPRLWLGTLYKPRMDVGFGTALLISGGLLAVAAALSGLMRGTVLSISVLSVAAGLILAETGAIHIDGSDSAVVHLFLLALIVTLFSDGLPGRTGAARLHWGPVVRALLIAMPLTLALLALAAKLLFSDLSWAEAFLLGAVLSATDPVVTSAVVTSKRVPATVRHALNLESGLNDGLALPFVLFFIILASPGGNAGSEAAKLVGEAAFGAVVGVVLGQAGGQADASPTREAGSSAATKGSTRSVSACSPTGSRTSPSATG